MENRPVCRLIRELDESRVRWQVCLGVHVNLHPVVFVMEGEKDDHGPRLLADDLQLHYPFLVAACTLVEWVTCVCQSA